MLVLTYANSMEVALYHRRHIDLRRWWPLLALPPDLARDRMVFDG